MKETDTLSQENNLELAIDAIRNGEVVGIPTETVYGIGVDPYSQTAVDKIFSLKERSEKKPLSILISSFHEIQKLNVTTSIPDVVELYWPGPLTIIVETSNDFANGVGTKEPSSIGVRVPENELAINLLKQTGPLAVTSANISGEEDFISDEQARDKMYDDAAAANNGEGAFWYTLNNYTLKEGVVTNSLIANSNQYRPGMSKYKDQNGDGVIDDDDRVIIGNTQPLFFGGISNTFSYGRFDLSMQFSFSYGNDIYNKNIPKATNTANAWNNKFGMVRERWDPENPNNTLTSFNAGASGDFAGAAHSYYIEDGSYLRLNNLSIGYKVPPKKLKKIKNIRLNATVNNLFILTNYSGWDPDVSVGRNQLTPGLDVDAYPRARTYTISAKINF